MKDKNFGIPSLKELSIIIISAFILTLVMSYLDAYERLHLFTRMYHLFTFDEFIVFMPSFLAMGFILLSYHKIQQLEFEITKREEVEEALRKSEKGYKDLSITDGLTQLFNSRHFYSQLEMEIDRASRYNHPLSLLLMDIDNFKQYNDTYGHLEGDKVLASFGKVVHRCVRAVDAGYRYGGEEFTVILPETEVQGAVYAAERIRKGFEAEIFSPKPNKTVNITVSIGVTQYEPKEKVKAFIKRADKAMYVAKKEGKNRVSFSKGTDVD